MAASKNKTSHSAATAIKPTVANSLQPFDKLNRFCNRLFTFKGILLLVVLSALTAFLVFYFDISNGADDSDYILRAKNLVLHHQFPSDQGFLFVLFLAGVYAFTGLNIMAMKLFVFATYLVFVYFFIQLLKKIAPPFALLLAYFYILFSPLILYYGSNVFTEMMSLLMATFFIYIFYQYFACLQSEARDFKPVKKDNLYLLFLSFLLLLCTLTKNAFLFIIIPAVSFLFLYKKFKSGIVLVGTFLIFFFSFMLIKSNITHAPLAQNGQVSILLNKDAYDPKKGKEDIGGFVNRVTENSTQYLSVHFLKSIGLASSGSETDGDDNSASGSGFVTILIYALSIFLLVKMYKKNPFIFLLGWFSCCMMVIQFLVLQTFWNQDRLIVPYLPFFFLFIAAAIYEWVKNKKILQNIYIGAGAVLVLLFIINYAKSYDSERLHEGLDGNKYFEFSEPFQNYLQTVEYASATIPVNEKIAVRKQGLAEIYGKTENYFVVWSTADAQNNIDNFLSNFKKNDVKYMIIDKFYGTMGNIANMIVTKYPGALKTVKSFGNTDASATLVSINYPPNIR